MAPQALRAGSARHTRLKRNQLADPVSVDTVADSDYRPGGLVTEDHWIAHHIVPDTIVLVVVDIGTADPDGSNFHQNLTKRLTSTPPTSTPSIRGDLSPDWDLGQVLTAVEVVTEDDTVGGDLVLARVWVVGAPAGLENGQCAFELGVSSEELEQDHIV